jgi:hypothetical protein
MDWTIANKACLKIIANVEIHDAGESPDLVGDLPMPG